MRFFPWIQVLAFACGMAGAAQPASARWLVAAGAGAAVPASTSALQEGLKAGISATCGAGARFGATALVGRMTYTHYARDDTGVMLSSGLASRPFNLLQMTGGQMATYDFVVDVRYIPTQRSPENTIHPFLLGAAGVSSHQYERVEIQYQYAGHTWPHSVPEASGTNASLGVGGGVRFDASRRWSVVFEGRYEQVRRRGDDLGTAHVRVELNVGL